MCPECFVNVVFLVTGVISTGGAASVAAKLFRKRKVTAIHEIRNPKDKENSK